MTFSTLLYSMVLGSWLFLGQADTKNVRRKYGCIELEEPLYGTLKFDEKRRSVLLVCDTGFLRIGSKRRSCRSGKWTGRLFNCIIPPKERKLCPVLDDLENGKAFVSGRKVGDSAHFRCDSGYMLDGANVRTCQRGRKWDGEPPVCLSRKSAQDLAILLETKFIDRYAAATADSKASSGGKLSMGKSGLDIVLVLDTSSSISPQSLEKAKSFMKVIVETFGVAPKTNSINGTRVALVTFTGKAKIVFNVDDQDVRSVEAVCKKIDEIHNTGGGTDFSSALSIVFKEIWLKKIKPDDVRASGATRAVFFITDSEETSINTTATEIKTRAAILKRYQFEIFAIGVGHNIDRVVLQDIASHPFLEHVFRINDFEDLNRIADIIAERNIDYGQCGISGVIKQSSGTSNKNSWPWIGWVSINDKLEPKTCGGALVCQRYFVTSAHCLHKVNRKGVTVQVKTGRILVYLSDHSIYKKDDTEVMAKVRHVYIHPNYTGKENDDNVREYDVAILDFGRNLTKQPTLNKQLRPICTATNTSEDGIYLHSRKVNERDSGYVAGWGHSPLNIYDGTFAPWGFLKQAKRKIQSDRRCGKKYPDINTDMFFCVGDVQENDLCRGDIGGPYMDLLPSKQFVLLGLALRTRDCTKQNQFSIFLNMLQEDIVAWMGKVTKKCNRLEKVNVNRDDESDDDDNTN